MANTRPKGYIDWNPSPDVAAVVRQVRAVLDEYAGYGPMTVRQVFYRLVGQYGYDKTERAYKRLGDYLVKARRAGMVPFGSIRDDGTVHHPAPQVTTRADVWTYITDMLATPHDYVHLDRNDGQPYHIELWCEAAGMAPMLSRMVQSRHVAVYSTGGFSSVTVTYEVAQRIAGRDKPTFFLHVGDYDPSGESIFTSMSQDIGSFVSSRIGGYYYGHTGKVEDADERPFFIPQRVALTEEQVEQYDLPTAPPKASDTRSVRWEAEGRFETTQAEAMPPTLLEKVVTAAVDELTDADALAELQKRERADKARLRTAVTERSVEEMLDELGLESPTMLEFAQAMADADREES